MVPLCWLFFVKPAFWLNTSPISVAPKSTRLCEMREHCCELFTLAHPAPAQGSEVHSRPGLKGAFSSSEVVEDKAKGLAFSYCEI